MKHCTYLFFVLQALIAASAFAGEKITPVAAYAPSSYSKRGAANAINGNGLSADGLTHGASANDTMWMNGNKSTPATWFLIDLGSVQPVGSLKIWNYNQEGTYMNRGASHIGLFAATIAAIDTTNPGFSAAAFTGDDTWTAIDLDITLGAGTGNANYTGEPLIEFPAVPARWIGIRIDSILSSTADYAGGFSEIQVFTGTLSGAQLDSITCPGTTSATVSGHLGGNISSSDSLQLAYGTTNGGEDASAWGNMVSVSDFDNGAFEIALTELAPDTIYYAALCEGTGSSASWGVPKAFMTAPVSVAVPADFYENDAAAHAIVFSRPASCSSAGLEIDYTVGGTAVAGTDYTALPGTVYFAPGMAEVSVPFTATNNKNTDGARTVAIGIPAGPYVVDATSSATFSILDDETDRRSLTWTGSGDGRLWSDPLNWSAQPVPTIADNVTVDQIAEPGILVSAPAQANQLEIAKGGNAYMDITADLTTSASLTVGHSSNRSAFIRQTAGTVTVGDTLAIGYANNNASVYDVSGTGASVQAKNILLSRYRGASASRLTVRDGATLTADRVTCTSEGSNATTPAARCTVEILNGASATVNTYYIASGGTGHTIVSNATLTVRGINSPNSTGNPDDPASLDILDGGVLTVTSAYKLCQYTSAYEYIAQWPGSQVTAPSLSMAGTDQGGTGTAHDIHYYVHGGTLSLSGDATIGNNGSASFDLDGGAATVGGNLILDALRDVAGSDPYNPSVLRLAGDASLSVGNQICFAGKQRGGRMVLALEGGGFTATAKSFTTKTLSTPADAALIRPVVTSTGLAPLRVTENVDLKLPFTVEPSATVDGLFGSFPILTWGGTFSGPENVFVLSESADPAEWSLMLDTNAKTLVLKRTRLATVLFLR